MYFLIHMILRLYKVNFYGIYAVVQGLRPFLTRRITKVTSVAERKCHYALAIILGSLSGFESSGINTYRVVGSCGSNNVPQNFPKGEAQSLYSFIVNELLI